MELDSVEYLVEVREQIGKSVLLEELAELVESVEFLEEWEYIRLIILINQ